MKIVLAQQNYIIGEFNYNGRKIVEAIQEAKKQQADLIVFTELAVCGYAPHDFLDFQDFVDECYQTVELIKQEADTIGVIVGSPARNPVKEGKDLFNAAFLLFEKEIKAEVHKTLLPTYDIFDEYRYFEPADNWNVVNFKGKRLAITICEDIWNVGENPLYRTCPLDVLAKQQPDIIINISASPFDYTHDEDRKAVIKWNVSKYKLPLIYCNCTGSQTTTVFDGGSLVFDANGNIVTSLPYFEESIQAIDWNDTGDFGGKIEREHFEIPDQQPDPETFVAEMNIQQVHKALVTGIRDYFQKLRFTSAIVGSSGGLDSAVVLALACEALGPDNVHALLMPSEFSTGHSVDDAVLLSQNLKNPYDTIPIKEIFDQYIGALKPVFKDLPFSVAEENLQARTRGALLMAVANKFGHILLNTSNKSELATGYGTLYGDMAGGISVLGDCYKTQVYALAAHINREREIIPKHIITKAPSAELRPNQKDTDSLPDYGVLDKLLYQYIEKQKSPAAIKEMGFEAGLVDRTIRRVNQNEYKRHQFCPIIRISPKAFGPGRRMPVAAKYLG